ncbi:hypothetical protein AMJ57_01545 [Parcubacteria bacterium SG8_24]|nr:MAG: hypothetical protein AMJ57_01545 [Parcubacteria bacterium SG8_24]
MGSSDRPKRISRLAVLLIALLMVGAGCVGYRDTDSEDVISLDGAGRPMVLVSDTRRKVDIEWDGAFQIVLPGNYTTGYRWEPYYDDAFLMLVSRKYETDSTSGMVGVGGQESFIFRGIKVGEAAVQFQYARPWEDEPLETRIYNVTITE